MKKKICLFLALVFVIMGTFPISVNASDISLLNNNTAITDTIFTISDSGMAAVAVQYHGYQNITTGATITIKIEKRNLLVFWNEVVSDTITVTGDCYLNEFYYQLEKSGTYRCTVVYTVSGHGGADDVITYEGKDSF